MTVTNENSRNDYISNGSAITYAFTFKVLNQENIQVIIADLNGVESILVLGVGYTVALDADTGLGTITLTTAATINHTISLLRNMDFEQNTAIQNQGSSQFSGKSFEQALDKLTLLSLQIKESIARAILLPKSSLLTELEIPVNLANAGKAIIVNPAGDNLEVKNLADISAAAFSALGLSLVAAETAAAMRTLLSAQTLNATLTNLAAKVVGNNSGDIPIVGSQSATTDLAGLVELLTNAELAAGTDTTRAATAAAVASLFGTSLRSASGYARLPVVVGGAFVEIILQWGTASITPSSPQAVTLPIAFPNAGLRGFSSPISTGANSYGGVTTVSTTQITIWVNNIGASVNWLAIGY
jgi:hypothetical protein